MRIVQFQADGADRWGTVDEEDRVTVREGCRSLLDVAGELDGDAADTSGTVRSLDSVALLSPVTPLARNVFCVGWNYDDHFAEGKAARGAGGAKEIPDRPTFFTKATEAVVGPYDAIASHQVLTDTLDWEVEFAVVIGRGGRDIVEAHALDHVLGYTVANDVSARNVQRGHGGQWFRGKSLDGTCPIGPWIVTRDAFEPIGSQRISCRVNGQTMQDATLADLHFSVPRIVAELSAGLTLRPGDVILTGTPSGVGFAREPAVYLRPGDVVESEIESIGTLRNEVAD